ncbi:ABC transporter permease family protein [Qiania dongpingensis]|uniref:ABC3 transporter permease protein domain-containing protein n=1 Tax=Qiania dongpingensis TaxID=2763669 RepID=A0A7G9G3R6_9FIRM|nr:hypothetical protein [Qiania dongpingensis]QNM05448.1 hypothetical protein H9Q78_13605 [Qiania dongpingensis]
MKIRKMLGYSLQGVVKSGAYRVFLLGVTLCIALPLLFITVTDSMFYTAQEKKKDLYGEFTDIFYGNETAGSLAGTAALEGMNDGSLKGLLDEKEIQKIRRLGNLYSADLACWKEQSPNLDADEAEKSLEQIFLKREKKEADYYGAGGTSGLLSVGYADETARELGRLRLKEGTWPLEGAVVITESLQKEWEEEPQPGDRVEWRGRSYLVSGILYDYGMLWVENVNQTDADRQRPDLFFSETDFKILLQGASDIQISHRTLMELRDVFSSDIYMEDYALVQNMAIKSEQFSVPPYLLYLVYICAALLLIQLLLLGLPRLEQRMRLYRLLGVPGASIPFLLYLDLFWVYILSLPIGILAGIGGAYLICSLGSRMISMPFLFRVSAAGMAGAAAMIGVLVLLSGVLPAVRLFRTEILEGQAVSFRRRRTQKRLIAGGLLGLLLICIFFLHGSSLCYLKADENRNLSVPLYGKISTDYDYEFLANTISDDTSYVDENGNSLSVSTSGPDDIYTVYNEPYLGMSEEDVEALRKEEGIQKVLAYKECSQLYMKADREDPYQKAMEDDMLSSQTVSFNEEMERIYGLDGSYQESRLQGYSEEELLSLAPYVEEGEIDLEKIRTGKEIILMVPDIQTEMWEYDDGTGQKNSAMSISYLEKGVYDGSEGQYSNRYYHVGDTIDVFRLYSENPELRGKVTAKIAEDEVKRQDFTFRIGAVIRCRAGWFEDTMRPEPFFNFLGLNDTFEAIGLPSTYTRVRVYGVNGEDGGTLKQNMYKLSGKLSEMHLDDRRGFMEEYRQYRLLLSVLSTLLTILSAIMGTGMITGRMLMRVREERKRTGLYQIAGCTRKRLFWSLIRPFIALVPAMWAVSMLLVRISSEYFFMLDGYWGFWQWMKVLVGAAFLSFAAVVITARAFFKDSISSLIRQED